MKRPEGQATPNGPRKLQAVMSMAMKTKPEEAHSSVLGLVSTSLLRHKTSIQIME